MRVKLKEDEMGGDYAAIETTHDVYVELCAVRDENRKIRKLSEQTLVALQELIVISKEGLIQAEKGCDKADEVVEALGRLHEDQKSK